MFTVHRSLILMKRLYIYILSLLAVAMLSSCQDDLDTAERDVQFAVRAAWRNGRADDSATRALSATDILAGGTSDINIDFADYPATINVRCSNGTDFTLAKGETKCTDHSGYWQYTPSLIFKDNQVKREELTFTASAVLDDVLGDGIDGKVEGECGFADIDGGHMLLTLHHTQALLRFAFKVSERYDKIRYIRVTGIRLNDANCTVVDKILNKTSMTYIGYAYVDPSVVTISYPNTLECTYNIYDKDAKFDGSMTATELAKHCTRNDVVAQNTFSFSQLNIDGSSSTEKKIKTGYYYDLHITLNPDYLYVLSDHDNKEHLSIN